jgi:multimeric flavodoxin WrbA
LNLEVDRMIEHLLSKEKVLFLTTSNRWEGDNEVPKSTQLARNIASKLGDRVTILDVPSLKIYPCEGNVSRFSGNNCGVKDSILKDAGKNPSGCHRCWASLNNPDDELWMVSKELLESDAVVFFISVRWGQANAFYQKLIERLNWLENRWTTLEEENILEGVEAGCVVIGQNWNEEEVMRTQMQVYEFYGFQVPPELSFNWQFTKDAMDETQASYKAAPGAFEMTFRMALKGAKKVSESLVPSFEYFKKLFTKRS